jgi:hypothetical protein
MTPVLTVLATILIMMRYRIVSSAVAFWSVDAMIEGFAMFLAFIMLMWAGSAGGKHLC